ncbi:hypothetical protein [Haloarchaeobius sp. HRN-SO-5]|uniref:hypothetical protein n=1 Tax=Haloarchaeobius sp. HRN-SO-5 TaxID=3446118 RepID=UPI003EB70C8F
MMLPRGDLVRSRTADTPAGALADALANRRTGYLVLEPADTVLGGTDGAGVLTLDDGVPVLAYHTGTDRGGPSALADLVTPGPVSVDTYAVAAGALDPVHALDEMTIPPASPAEQLADDPDLAARTRDVAPEDRLTGDDADGTLDPVEAFLADEDRLDAIREQARAEAERKADAWGLSDALVDPEEE